MSREHVIPVNIGGSVEPRNPFVLENVCSDCNEKAGLYIDAPFTRSWLIKQTRVTNSRAIVDLARQPVLPLRYMGVCKNIEWQDHHCDFWLGPAGDSIYHFHQPFGKKVATYGGGRPFKNAKTDPGFVFVFVAASNPAWHPTILYSVLANFKKSPCYLGNGPRPLDKFEEIPAHLKDLHNDLLKMGGKNHKCSFDITIDFHERFTAKVALGLGHLFLNDSFKDSVDAKKLRSFMWTSDSKQRIGTGIRVSSFFRSRIKQDDEKFLKDLFSIPGTHCLSLFSLGEHLICNISIYGEHLTSIVLSSDARHWHGKIGNRDALTFIIIPGLRQYLGPFGMIDLVKRMTNDLAADHPITLLENQLKNYTLPPFMLNEST